MPNTVPNQRVVAIHRETAKADFLGIKNSNWQAAARDLGAHAFMLYIYFASNANGYTLALSPAAVRQAIAMPSSTYRDQFLKLVDKGYLVQRGEGGELLLLGEQAEEHAEEAHIRHHGGQNILERQRVTRTENESTADGFDFAANVQQKTKSVQNRTGENIEININNTNSIINRGVEKQVSPAPKSEFVF